jgi:hypothetical protein
MSNKAIVQSSPVTVEVNSPEHHIPPTTAEANVQPDQEVKPNTNPNSQETESAGYEPDRVITTTASTIADGETRPCLEARSSVTRSSQEKSTAAPEPARNIAKNLGSSSLAFATGLLPIYFLLFAALAFKNNDAFLELGSQAAWLLAAAKYVCSSRNKVPTWHRLTLVQGPSVFPIMFAAIVGQLMTVIASWKLERSITIGRLEYLLGSRSLGAAFISLIKLRIINTLVPVILIVWCLSPLGGQASLRAVSSDVAYTNSSADFYYLDNNNNTTPINVYASAADSYNPVIDSLFVTALASSNASKNGSQDMYGNIHIPMLESIISEPITDAWFDLRDQNTPVHTALLGMPFSGVSNAANSSFTVHTSYVFCSCTLNVQLVVGDGYVWNISSNSDDGSGPRTYGRMNATGPRLRDNHPAHQRNDTFPRLIGLQSRSFGLPPVSETQAWCNLTTTYIEVQVQCSGGPHSCTATSVRKIPDQPSPATATTLDCNLGDGNCQPRFLAESLFRHFMNAVPKTSHGDYTPTEQFFLTPDAPFIFPNSTLPIGDVGEKLFSQRLTQLLNTYLLTSSAPYAISGNFTHSNQDELYLAGHSISSSSPSYGIQSVQARVETSQVVLRCHVAWTITLIAISSLLIAAGLSTAIIDSYRMGPQVLDDFTSSLRYNPYAAVEQKNRSSMESTLRVGPAMSKFSLEMSDRMMRLGSLRLRL